MKDIKYIIGKNLKTIRKDKHLTLQQLSEITNVSKSMLGEIERGITNPTITLLWKITNGLKIPFNYLIKEEKQPVTVIYNKDIDTISEGIGYKISSIIPYNEDKKMEIYYTEFNSASKLESEGHSKSVEEYILVMSGTLSVKLKDKIYSLSEGDAINFVADYPHAYFNMKKDTAKAYIIMYYQD